ncbi:NTP transferase domain-containing protein [Iodidimonas sp. SYSU 1G8]|uniref:NTP transferase domain-containing protein n=1 Tax=Iodidimonas sp. SYSU 1G8 TaxID=3133967 RepID=UPI0031FEE4C9
MDQKRCVALIMAANRKGGANPVAEQAGVSHKCLTQLAGITMIERVLRVIRSSGRFHRLIVSIEDSNLFENIPYICQLVESGQLEIIESKETLEGSAIAVASRLAEADYPLFITTADNVLHTEGVISGFIDEAHASGVDVAFALTPRSVVESAYPSEAPTIGYLKFADGDHSNCNVYYLRDSGALRAVKVMRYGGQFRSHPWRILRAVGLGTLIRYKLGLLTLEDLLKRLRNLFNLSIGIIIIRMAEAPIDVDGSESLVLAERILSLREARNAA